MSDERGTLLFRSKKQEIEDRVAKLTEEIKGLQPEKEQTSNKEVYLQLFDPQESLPVGGLKGERCGYEMIGAMYRWQHRPPSANSANKKLTQQRR